MPVLAPVAGNADQHYGALEITVDLENKQVNYDTEWISCEIPESARSALVTGQFDFLAQLLEGKPQIEQTAHSLPYMNTSEDACATLHSQKSHSKHLSDSQKTLDRREQSLSVASVPFCSNPNCNGNIPRFY